MDDVGDGQRPATAAGQVAPSEVCLACSECGQAVATAASLMPDRLRNTLRKAVYAYELGVLGVPTWCYSATGAAEERFDVVRVSEVCVGGARSSRLCDVLGTRRATGVVVAKQEPPTSEHSWFPGFAYQAVRCGGCAGRRLLGWAFTPEEPTDFQYDAGGFFGLIITRLRERPMDCLGNAWSTPTAGGPLLLSVGRRGNWRQLRGLTAGTVSGTSAPGAAAAARGQGSMPVQLIPSTSTGGRSPAVTVRRFTSLEEPGESGGSSDESLDFQLQRRTRRSEAQRRFSGSAGFESGGVRGPSEACLRPRPRGGPQTSRSGRAPIHQPVRGQGKQLRRRPLIVDAVSAAAVSSPAVPAVAAGRSLSHPLPVRPLP